MDDLKIFAWLMTEDRRVLWIAWVPETRTAIRIPLHSPGDETTWKSGTHSREFALDWTTEAEADGFVLDELVHTNIERGALMEVLQGVAGGHPANALVNHLVLYGITIPLSTGTPS